MAWITTDTDVACTLIVRKTVAGGSVPGYPKEFSILAAFNNYQAITVDDWHKMETEPRDERINAFKLYVNQIESMDVDSTAINEVYRQSSETPGVIVSG